MEWLREPGIVNLIRLILEVLILLALLQVIRLLGEIKQSGLAEKRVAPKLVNSPPLGEASQTPGGSGKLDLPSTLSRAVTPEVVAAISAALAVYLGDDADRYSITSIQPYQFSNGQNSPWGIAGRLELMEAHQ